MSENRRFMCPYCDHELSLPDKDVVRMKGRLKGHHFSVVATFDVPSGLGVYGGHWNDYLTLEEGGIVEFFCPHCGDSFTARYDERLAEIKMTEAGKTYIVVFNRTFGAHSSFLVDHGQRELVASYGEHATDYIQEFGKNINYFGT